MVIASRAPAPALRGLVHGYQGYVGEGIPVRRTELPWNGIVLIVSFGPRLAIAEHGRTYGSFVAGLHDFAVTTRHDGVQDGIQIDVSPLTARMLTGVPMDELHDRVEYAADVLPRFDELVERLHDAAGWGERFALLDGALARRMADAPRPSAPVARAYARLVGTHGATPVERIAAELGWSRRHLASRFKREIGMAPKAFARMLRFQRAVELLDEGVELARVAAACGYADQPHMTREFKAFAGISPGRFPFLQDAAAAA